MHTSCQQDLVALIYEKKTQDTSFYSYQVFLKFQKYGVKSAHVWKQSTWDCFINHNEIFYKTHLDFFIKHNDFFIKHNGIFGHYAPYTRLFLLK